jgi:glyoxylase-like metal-dependent hydrolase (beta-lactamase superfamily II)
MLRHPLTRRHGLQEPVTMGTIDRERNRESLRRLAALDPAIVCFGHGEPLRDASAFRRFAEGVAAAARA